MSAEATASSTVNSYHVETGGQNKKYVVHIIIHLQSIPQMEKIGCLTTIQTEE